MIKGNCRWIVIGLTLLIFVSSPFWAPPLFTLYVRLYTHPGNNSNKALLLKKYMELLDRCPTPP